MKRWKTIRQRRSRARKGQVSAVATTLGLLLVVSLIANFMLLQLPNEMTQLEVQHQLLVEDQMARFQQQVWAQGANLGLPVTLTSPVTLGSQANPPFGVAAPSTISVAPTTIRSSVTLSSTTISYNPPAWGTFSPCFSATGGSCSGSGFFYANLLGPNRTSFTLSVAGSANWEYNLTLNNDTVTVTWNGANPGPEIVVINGSYNNVIFQKSGSATSNPVIEFLFFGTHDTLSVSDNGGGTGGVTTVYTQFVGYLNNICPAQNLSGTDHLIALSSLGNSQLNVSVTWWNAIGYASAPVTQSFSGGTVTWQNKTGLVPCAFNTGSSSIHTTVLLLGLLVHLSNHYAPAADVAFDQGAVILAEQVGTPVMIEPPAITYGTEPLGATVKLTLFNFVGSATSEAGVTTAGIQTTLLSSQQYSLNTGITGTVLVSYPTLNITTFYPAAWENFFTTLPHSFVPTGSVQCVETTPFAGSCLSPPSNVPVTISVTLVVAQFSINVATIQVALL